MAWTLSLRFCYTSHSLLPRVIDSEWNVRIDGSVTQRLSRFVAVKEIAVKKCVVKLSMEERGQLDTLIRSGKHPARKLTPACILLKADAGEAGEGGSDSQIAAALDIGLVLPQTGMRVVTETRCFASSRPQSTHPVAAVDVVGLRNDIVGIRARQERRQPAYFLRPGHAPDRDAGAD
jgi:hypothetical protein